MPLHSADITIIVPTFNRADFLARLLDYYARVQFQGRVLIGDAGHEGQAGVVRAELERHRDSLNIDYHRFPGESIARTVFKLNDFIKTPFVVLTGDDDFLLVEGLCRCADFLKGHSDYIAANGAGYLLRAKNNGTYGNHVDDYLLKSIEAENPAQRLEDFLKNYFVALFSLFRTEVWRRMWTDSGTVKDVDFAAELAPNSVGVVCGKIKHLNVLCLLRIQHDRRYELLKVGHWIISPQWQEGYRFFETCVKEALIAEGVEASETEKIIESAFVSYIEQRVVRKVLSSRKSVKKMLRRRFNLVRLRPVWQLVTQS